METSSEPLTLSNQIATQLGIKPDARVTRIDVAIDYSGYFAVAAQCYNTALSRYRIWYPDVEIPLSQEEYILVCAALLRKRLDFVHSELFSSPMSQTGIGKSVFIPEPLFDRLYAYGAIRVGSTMYVPDTELRVSRSDVKLDSLRIPNELLARWASFHFNLEHRWLMSKAMPAKPTGTLMLLFWVDRLEDSNIPRCLTDQGTGADAVMAGMSPDTLIAFQRGRVNLPLRQVAPLIFTVPYTAVESPEQLLIDYVQRSFRGGSSL